VKSTAMHHAYVGNASAVYVETSGRGDQMW
jgi:hypothetical protein